jgi:formate dehydrogenase subunit delta
MSGTEDRGAGIASAPHEDAQSNSEHASIEHGSTEHIVRMANDIGNFFRAEPDRRVAVEGIANHINKFWTRRMRQKLLQYVAQGGTELDELPRTALAQVSAAPPVTQPRDGEAA